MNSCPKCWGTGVEIDHVELGDRARAHRMIRKLSLGESARKLGVSEGFLSYLERGQRKWTKKLFAKAISL